MFGLNMMNFAVDIKHFVLFDKKILDFNMHPQGGLNYSVTVYAVNESINSNACVRLYDYSSPG
ncbi:hypothetical protein AA106_10545 [Photorhabdus laumondii subsp. laumondii]|uniref:Photorhabdus luminescens subsp. laumondii TTO1 complete genome segment 15/17 n=1 Tax=Photorhabdus laumondii subsp. laumondii (strain DSM 15139 / CIP 105565 / TT01) TaxID=243265 RepID=Q7MZR4_PHOLL|nr:hypothetical protein A4R40_20885 [Photorhabdus laumondii subsp. laumondii]RAW69232.1 hypothetical protein CKY15_14440 [Photorhabdus sp. S7-51]RAW70391.1 hypothetical protein CKY14_14615 [Photorhabdus sp. S14-60]RAW76874.1 hypothetical protein CKY06_14905 [Photorhabdus sp. S15-56]RAW83406.1 hypothetical protein CKY12_14720 [Photorhabdus sp. S12-55]RAW83460.1 hypothetical protein CKY09_14450 [Photorhabdus sp. S5P8-50]CAE16585.1 unnamed protein product [Photorhabdus laumondii subsp. laumondii